MKDLRLFLAILTVFCLIAMPTRLMAQGQDYSGNEDPNKKIIKNGLLGAGVGAISAGASGGSAGKGALIGAGTNVIGGALLDTLTTPSQPQPQYAQQQPVYVQQAPQPQYVQQSAYPVQTQSSYRVDTQPVYVQEAPAYYNPPPQEDPNKKILKQGLLGAGVGAISASASGGKAGKGALIGAGTNVIGGALLDSLMGPSQTQQPQPVYVQQAPQYQYQQPPQPAYPPPNPTQPHKKIIRKYDSDGKLISEEEVWE